MKVANRPMIGSGVARGGQGASAPGRQGWGRQNE